MERARRREEGLLQLDQVITLQASQASCAQIWFGIERLSRSGHPADWFGTQSAVWQAVWIVPKFRFEGGESQGCQRQPRQFEEVTAV
jgi:hypothetical protein